MVKLINDGVYFCGGKFTDAAPAGCDIAAARAGTISYKILQDHNLSNDPSMLSIKFDALASHDITYVGIIQTARASGLEKFPLPYVLTNCHNSLCAVGGTINEDDHVFGLSAAQKYGGIYVPAHMAVIHSYMREMMAACGKMILGSDSHTRYGALGTMAVGEGGPELVKQLLSKTYEIEYPEIVAVRLEGSPRPGVGPQDVALAIIGAVFETGFVKNKVLEFVGPGIKNLSVDFRAGIDVMTTETTCLSTIWMTDEKVREYFTVHGRPEAYKELKPADCAYYDSAVEVDLSAVECMIALPFHPSNVFTIRQFNSNAGDILRQAEIEGAKSIDNPDIKFTLTDKIQNGRVKADQGEIAGCAGGTFENICTAASILHGKSTGNGEFGLSVYPGSQPIYMELIKNGVASDLMASGAILRSAFCGPCFGACDVPANNGFSIRHTTRNFPSREGSKPGNGQIASVALMDARSIAASAAEGGYITAATDISTSETTKKFVFDSSAYKSKIYDGTGNPKPELPLKFGPNIADWPKMDRLPEHLLLKLAAVIHDPVTTTDELIPSGETSSYRSNPMKLAEFTLSRKDPLYVKRAKAIKVLEAERKQAVIGGAEAAFMADIFAVAAEKTGTDAVSLVRNTGVGSVIFARKPGDGSAREQAASCQRVLGGAANIAEEYATKRYRSNLINWGMIPFTVDKRFSELFENDSYIFVKDIRKAVETGSSEAAAYIFTDGKAQELTLKLENISAGDREIILDGCLINFYAAGKK